MKSFYYPIHENFLPQNPLYGSVAVALSINIKGLGRSLALMRRRIWCGMTYNSYMNIVADLRVAELLYSLYKVLLIFISTSVQCEKVIM